MTWLTLAMMTALAPQATARPQAKTAPRGQIVALWPEGVLTGQPERPQRVARVNTTARRGVIKVANVSRPTVTIYRPKGRSGQAAAVVICPGGGYSILAYDLEGTEIARWLNSLGIAGIVLKYRVPRQRDAAFQDAQRAVSLVRSRAQQWGIDGKRIGILGFSAGGHLAARVCTNFQKRSYPPADDADEASCRPDFAVLIYPAYLSNAGKTGLDTATLPVAAKTPSTFIAIACNDKFTPGALHYFRALRAAGVPSELHVFQFGGHGCGLRKTDANVTTWPEHCERWLRGLKVLPARPAPASAEGTTR
jgi:acetyl esterase/lipase